MNLKEVNVEKVGVWILGVILLTAVVIIIGKVNLAPEGAALLGVLFGSLGSGAVTWYTKRSEERRHFRELMVKSAIENWKQMTEVGRAYAATGQTVELGPLDAYLIHAADLFNLVLDKKLDLNQTLEALKEVRIRSEKIRNSFKDSSQINQNEIAEDPTI